MEDKRLSKEEIEKKIKELSDWKEESEKIIKEYEFPNFKSAFDFVNKIVKIAEYENHHPDILLSYKKIKVFLTTHKLDGLSDKDFSIAKKIDEILK